jgi:hypothetical protein
MKQKKTHKIQYIQAYAVQTFKVSPVDILRINIKVIMKKKITQISELTYQIYGW